MSSFCCPVTMLVPHVIVQETPSILKHSRNMNVEIWNTISKRNEH